MNTAKLFDEILSTLENPVGNIDANEAVAQEVVAERAAHTAELLKVRELMASLRAVHPDTLLSKLIVRERDLTMYGLTVSNAEKALVAAVGPTPRENEIKERIQDLMHLEQELTRSNRLSATGITDVRYLPTKYVRGDAVEHFGAEAKAAEKEKTKLTAQFDSHPNVSPGPRIVSRLRELGAVIDEWPRTEKLCQIGERVFAIREERRSLQEELADIQAAKRNEVLQVA
jgi:hypothetical protein